MTGAEAIDWEDIAARGRTLYVGDIGDNLAARPNVTVYRFAEPPPGVTSVAAQRIDLRYADGAHDAETLLVDPRSRRDRRRHQGRRRRQAGVYVASKGRLRKRATLELGIGQPLTAGDVSGDGRTIVLRSYDRAFVFARRAGESLASALEAPTVHRRRGPARRGPGRVARPDPRRARVLHRARRPAAGPAPLRRAVGTARRRARARGGRERSTARPARAARRSAPGTRRRSPSPRRTAREPTTCRRSGATAVQETGSPVSTARACSTLSTRRPTNAVDQGRDEEPNR